MKTYKYTDETNTIVLVIDADGISRLSMLASLVPDGAQIAPADQPALIELVSEALAEVRALRRDFLAILAGLQSEALTLGDQALALEIASIQRGAKDITLTDLSACTTRAQIDAELLSAWAALVANAPASVITAFKSVKS